MWRMHDGDRVLTDGEWEVFCAGLEFLRDEVEAGISAGDDETRTGVGVFDRLTAEQKLALLADVASALRDPSVPMPAHTAANEGAIMAVLATFRVMLRSEVEEGEPGQTELRQALLAAVAGDGTDEHPDPLPTPSSREWADWEGLYDCVETRVLWDYDFDLADEILDLPPDQSRAAMDALTIDRDYFRAVPPDPDREGLIAARQKLARLMESAVPDDGDSCACLWDKYHDLIAGPVTPKQSAAWRDSPWVEVVSHPDPKPDCDHATWLREFASAVPTTPFTVTPADSSASYELPNGVRVEPSASGWVVRNERSDSWCGLVDNCWTDVPDESIPALVFPTEADARAAFAQAERMYDEREKRHAAACAKLGIAGE